MSNVKKSVKKAGVCGGQNWVGPVPKRAPLWVCGSTVTWWCLPAYSNQAKQIRTAKLTRPSSFEYKKVKNKKSQKKEKKERKRNTLPTPKLYIFFFYKGNSWTIFFQIMNSSIYLNIFKNFFLLFFLFFYNYSKNNNQKKIKKKKKYLRMIFCNQTLNPKPKLGSYDVNPPLCMGPKD